MKLRNLALFAFSYQLRKIELNYYPFFIWVEPTNYCNLKCVTCPQSMNYSIEKGYMRIETYKKILEEIRTFSPMMLSLHLGGESLLHKELTEMIRLAKGKNLEVTLASNATLLTKEKSEEIIRAGLDGITVNFSSDKDGFEKNYKGARWDKVYKNIRDFLEIKKEMGKINPFFSIQVLTKNDEDGSIKKNIKDLEQLFYDLPYNSIINIDMHNWSGDFADMLIKEPCCEIKKDKKRYFPCSHLWSSMVIRWNGDIVPCCRDLQSGMVLGNINKETLVEIWNNKEIIELRRKHRDFEYHKVQICKNCSKPWEGARPRHLLYKHLSKIPLIIKSHFKSSNVFRNNAKADEGFDTK